MLSQKINVLYLDDEEANLTSFKANFRREFNVFGVKTPDAALAVLDNQLIHVAISDHKMPTITGVQFFEKLSLTHPDIIRILLTGYKDIDTVIEAINRGQVYRYFTKPMDPDEIKETINGAYQFYLANKSTRETYRKLLDENEQLEFMLRQKLIS